MLDHVTRNEFLPRETTSALGTEHGTFVVPLIARDQDGRFSQGRSLRTSEARRIYLGLKVSFFL